MNSSAARLADLVAAPPQVGGVAATAPAGARLEIVRDEPGFLALAPHWDDLLARSATRTPFLTWDWVSLWWDEYRNDFQPALGVVRGESGDPLAIAPLVIGRPAAGARRALRHITFFGGIGDITSEGMDFLVPRGLEDSLTPMLCEVFRRTRGAWDAARLPMMHEESPNLPHLLSALRGPGSGAGIVERQPSRFIKLPDSWEGIEKSHGNNWRSNHRRKWRRMIQDHAGRPLAGGVDLPADAAFDALLELHARRWSAEESLFLRERARSFHRRLAQRWLPSGRLDISLLELEGRPGAATYCFLHDRRAWFYQAGWNADYGSISIGKLAIAWSIQCAIRRGMAEFDFLPGDYSYKEEWSDSVRHVVEVEAFSPSSPRAALFRLLRFCKRRTTGAGRA